MIRFLQLKNFKSWARAKVEFAPLTAFFGPNSSGKSSLIQFLLLLKQTKEATDRALALDFGGPTSYANLGTFSDAVFAHDTSNAISWSLSWQTPEPLKIVEPGGPRTSILFEGDLIQISAEAAQRGRQVSCERLMYEFAGAEFSLKRKSAVKSGFELKTLNNKEFRFIRTLGRAWDLPGPIKSYAFPDQVKTYFQNSDFLSQFELAYEQLMDRLIHLGPLRDYPKREYTWSGARPVDVGRRGERVVDAILAATERNETRNVGPKKRRQPFQGFIASWLQKMGLISSFTVEEIARGSSLYRVSLQTDRASPKVLLTDVGFGVSQVLPALVLLYYAPEGSTIILEQPEIHLHPSVQASLADVILNAIETRGLQVIVESHSEHLLRRIQRRIAEESFSNRNAKLYFCNLHNGQSRLRKLDIDLFGRILNWPPDFFGDEFDEIAAREEAALARLAKAK